jgi:replication-associated recombination protein RarA
MRYILGYMVNSYLAIGTGATISKTNWDLSVPIHLRNAPTKLMKGWDMAETTSILITK